MLLQNRLDWRKNLRPSDSSSIGVDLTRNFGFQWDACPKITSTYSINFPGPKPFSENETMFIKEALLRYKDKTKAYVSIRMNGHSLLYPFSYAEVKIHNEGQVHKIANEVANKINQRAGVITTFINDSIIGMNGKPRCGSSVDYAYDLGIPYAFEMRVFLGRTSRVMAEFQAVPRGYHSQLLLGYLSGIKKLCNLIITDKSLASKAPNLI